tara:strand:- start:1187 stop:1558 length:372 start_codon:yes stop_codon:yes gene_type:complete
MMATLTHRFWQSALLLVLAFSSLVGTGCRRKGKTAEVVYINRAQNLGLAEQRALDAAMGEVQKWDTGANVRDSRVQRHSKGWNVSLLLQEGFDDKGNPTFSDMPVRNVEIDMDGNVIGYHTSR